MKSKTIRLQKSLISTSKVNCLRFSSFHSHLTLLKYTIQLSSGCQIEDQFIINGYFLPLDKVLIESLAFLGDSVWQDTMFDKLTKVRQTIALQEMERWPRKCKTQTFVVSFCTILWHKS